MSQKLSEYNIALLKFHSKLLHVCLAVASGRTVSTGYKALDKFCLMLGFENYGEATIEIKRSINKVKMMGFVPKGVIFQVYADSFDREVLEDACLYYNHYFFAPNWLPEARLAYNKLLAGMDSFFQFPMRGGSYSLNGDNLAVEFARYLGASELMEKQLCGIFMILYQFYENDLIEGFGFQDVLDFLEPNHYVSNNLRYQTEMRASLLSDNTSPECFSKIMRFCDADALASHHQFFFEKLSEISKAPLSLTVVDTTIFQKACSNLEVNFP